MNIICESGVDDLSKVLNVWNRYVGKKTQQA